MSEYTLNDFVMNTAVIVTNVALNAEQATIRVGNGYSAVIVDGGEYEMLQQALKLCEEHPSWQTEK